MNNDEDPDRRVREAARRSSTRPSSTPREWVALAKAAGMKYITITSKHHDGFAMFDSKVTDYDIVDAHAVQEGPAEDAGRRVPQAGHQALLLLLAARLASPRLLPARPHRPGRRPAGARATGTGTSTTWTRSSRELCTDYGEIGGIWFDGWWDQPDADWRLDQHLQADPRAAARGAGRQQPPPPPVPGRGLPDVREGPARREHGRLQQGLRDRRPCRWRPARR